MKRTSVLIVGAGPVGLMLAVQLQLRRVPFRLIEAREGRDYKVKAMGITPRTLEIFDQMGILDEALERGLFFSAVNTVVAGQLQARVAVDPTAQPYGALALGQYDSEGRSRARESIRQRGSLLRLGGRLRRRPQSGAQIGGDRLRRGSLGAALSAGRRRVELGAPSQRGLEIHPALGRRRAAQRGGVRAHPR